MFHHRVDDRQQFMDDGDAPGGIGAQAESLGGLHDVATVEGGDYLVYGHALPDNAGHLLALTCK